MYNCFFSPPILITYVTSDIEKILQQGNYNQKYKLSPTFLHRIYNWGPTNEKRKTYAKEFVQITMAPKGFHVSELPKISFMLTRFVYIIHL
jgi:hypothetical protein